MRVPSRRSALLALLVVTLIWGFSFIWMKQNLSAAERVLGRPGGITVVAAYMAARFGIATLGLLFWPAARKITRGAWNAGFILGLILAGGFFLQILGLQHITPPVSAFLTSLYVVFAAILTAAHDRARPKPALIAGVVLATFGAGFIEGPPHLTFGLAEWLTVGCAAIFGAHILATDKLTRTNDPAAVSLASFIWTAGLGGVVTILALLSPKTPTAQQLAAVFRDTEFATTLVLAAVLSTILALTLMNLFQRGLDPVRAAIVYALEPVWTTLIAWALGLGSPSAWLLAGGSALLLGNVVAELGAAPVNQPAESARGPSSSA